MMKAMISQPMAGKTDGEIAKTRERAKAKLAEMGYELSQGGTAPSSGTRRRCRRR